MYYFSWSTESFSTPSLQPAMSALPVSRNHNWLYDISLQSVLPEFFTVPAFQRNRCRLATSVWPFPVIFYASAQISADIHILQDTWGFPSFIVPHLLFERCFHTWPRLASIMLTFPVHHWTRQKENAFWLLTGCEWLAGFFNYLDLIYTHKSTIKKLWLPQMHASCNYL